MACVCVCVCVVVLVADPQALRDRNFRRRQKQCCREYRVELPEPGPTCSSTCRETFRASRFTVGFRWDQTALLPSQRPPCICVSTSVKMRTTRVPRRIGRRHSSEKQFIFNSLVFSGQSLLLFLLFFFTIAPVIIVVLINYFQWRFIGEHHALEVNSRRLHKHGDGRLCQVGQLLQRGALESVGQEPSVQLGKQVPRQVSARQILRLDAGRDGDHPLQLAEQPALGLGLLLRLCIRGLVGGDGAGVPVGAKVHVPVAVDVVRAAPAERRRCRGGEQVAPGAVLFRSVVWGGPADLGLAVVEIGAAGDGDFHAGGAVGDFGEPAGAGVGVALVEDHGELDGRQWRAGSLCLGGGSWGWDGGGGDFWGFSWDWGSVWGGGGGGGGGGNRGSRFVAAVVVVVVVVGVNVKVDLLLAALLARPSEREDVPARKEGALVAGQVGVDDGFAAGRVAAPVSRRRRRGVGGDGGCLHAGAACVAH
ncbi:hypothetical protein DFJ73DRAFT_948349, partial [Zopfochytrium polystomum]